MRLKYSSAGIPLLLFRNTQVVIASSPCTTVVFSGSTNSPPNSADIAFVNPGFFSVVVALGIATCKMLLVVLFFMHARHSSQLTKLSLLAAVLWLCILLGMVSIDFWSRGWMGLPGR